MVKLIGIFGISLSGLALVLFALILALMVFVPLIVAFIILLVKCIKNRWAKKYLIPFIVISSILGLVIISGLF